MARYQLSSPDQPWLVRSLLRLYEFAASLKLAVVLILACAGTLAYATFVEAAYGTPVVQYGVYQTLWFEGLLLLLAVNIFCAASIRYPWERHQTGFVITHIGLLVMLFGTALSRLYGIDSQIPIYEYSAENWAFGEGMKFQLVEQVEAEDSPASESSDPHAGITLAGNQGLADLKEKTIATVPFDAGPFNWSDYANKFPFWQEDPAGQRTTLDNLAAIPWNLFRWSTGKIFSMGRRVGAGDVLYNRDGVKLEVLEYYGDSRVVNAPMVTIKMSVPRQKKMGPDGREVEGPQQWMPVELSVRQVPGLKEEFPHGMGDRSRVGGGALIFWMTGSKAETDAFLDSKPADDLGQDGYVVLHAGGERFGFLVEEKLGKGKFSLGKPTGLEAEVTDYFPKAIQDPNAPAGTLRWVNDATATEATNPAVKIAIFRDGQPAGRLTLLADMPDVNVQDHQNQVFGDYWFNHGKKTAAELMQGGGGSRLDIIQAHNQHLYYRYWNRETVVFAQPLPVAAVDEQGVWHGVEEDALDAFKMPIAQLQLYVQDFVPAEEPELKTLPLPFEREKNMGRRRPAAEVRLTVDDTEETFWIAAYMDSPDRPPRSETQRHTQQGKDRTVTLTMPTDATNIGYRIRLREFERKLDPGTSQPSHYSSTVDLLDLERERTIQSCRLNGRGVRDLKIPGMTSGDAVAVDAKAALIYWTNAEAGQILYAPLAGGDPAVVLAKTNVATPTCLAVDAEGKLLYWGEFIAGQLGDEVGRIRRVTLDGTKPETVATFPGRPTGLVLASDSDRVYFAWHNLHTTRQRIGPPSDISYVSTAGGDAVNLGAHTTEPASLSLDAEHGRLYWAEPAEGEIRSIQLTGGESSTIALITPNKQPTSVVVDGPAGYLYWTDTFEVPLPDNGLHPTEQRIRHRIRRAALDGSNVQDIVEEQVHVPLGLALDRDNGRLYWTEDAVMRSKVWITMNAPIDFADSRSGRSYRLFQESFSGPFKPGSAEYENFMPKSEKEQEELYMSILTVNYDPGRAIRSLGLLLIIVGIATMFYMKAYFSKKSAAREAARAAANKTSQKQTAVTAEVV